MEQLSRKLENSKRKSQAMKNYVGRSSEHIEGRRFQDEMISTDSLDVRFEYSGGKNHPPVARVDKIG